MCWFAMQLTNQIASLEETVFVSYLLRGNYFCSPRRFVHGDHAFVFFLEKDVHLLDTTECFFPEKNSLHAMWYMAKSKQGWKTLETKKMSAHASEPRLPRSAVASSLQSSFVVCTQGISTADHRSYCLHAGHLYSRPP